MSICRHFWGTTAILLGVWEGLAYAKQLPTITATSHRFQTRHGRKATVAVAIMLVSLGKHLSP